VGDRRRLERRNALRTGRRRERDSDDARGVFVGILGFAGAGDTGRERLRSRRERPHRRNQPPGQRRHRRLADRRRTDGDRYLHRVSDRDRVHRDRIGHRRRIRARRRSGLGKYAEIGAVWVLSRRSSAGNRLRYCERSSATGRSRGRQRSTLAGIVGTVVANPSSRFSHRSGNARRCRATLVSVDGTIATIAISLGLGAVAAALVRWDIGRDQAGGLRRFLLSLGALVAFSAGASQVGLAVGPLFPLLEDLPSVSPIAVLLGGGVGILVGSWTSAPQ